MRTLETSIEIIQTFYNEEDPGPYGLIPPYPSINFL